MAEFCVRDATRRSSSPAETVDGHDEPHGPPGSSVTISITVPATGQCSERNHSGHRPEQCWSGNLRGTTNLARTGQRGTDGTLPVTPVPVLPSASSLTLSPTSVTSGAQSSTGTVTLSGPAPAGGAHVMLSGSNRAASVAASVTAPAGSSTATFTVNTSIVVLSTSATISASYNNTIQTARLGVLL
jgi:hypothetical protein